MKKNDNIYTKLLVKLGYKFKNIKLLELSLIHKSINYQVNKNNERLELLGDVILNAIVTIFLMDKLPNASEGQIVKLKSLIVSKNGLGKIARFLHLFDFIKISNNLINNNLIINNDKLLSCFIESLFGAIFTDNKNFFLTKKLFLNVLNKCKNDILQDENFYDYKSFIQVRAHAQFGYTPSYRLSKKFILNNVFWFKVELLLNNKVISFGIGKNKLEAEQQAAKKYCLINNWKIENFYSNIFK